MTEESRKSLTDESRRTWTVATPGWERQADLIATTSARITAWVIDHVDPREGDIVLELGAGPGDLGFQIAVLVGPAGRVISTDFVPGMVDVARRRAGAFGVSNVEFREMDAQDIDLPDDTVDVVVHRFGPMLLPDPERSARHVRRALRPGGRYATVVWGRLERNPMFPLIGRTLAKMGLTVGGPPPGGLQLDFGDPAVTRDLLERTGFVNVTVEEVDQPFTFESFEEFWAMPTQIAGPIAELLRGLDEPEYQRAKAAIREASEPFRNGDRYEVPGLAVCASAIAP